MKAILILVVVGIFAFSITLVSAQPIIVPDFNSMEDGRITGNVVQSTQLTDFPKPLQGCPSDDTYINGNTILSNEYCLVNDTNNDGILIINASDITLDCNGMTLESIVNPPSLHGGTGIVSNKSNVTIKNCNMKKFYAAIDLYEGADYNKIYDNTLDDNNGGIFIHGNRSNYVMNTLIENNKGNYNNVAVFLDTTFLTLINNNTFNVGYYGFDLRENVYNTTITNNILNSSSDYYTQYASGILLYAQINTTVVKNVFNRNNKGIYFYAGWPATVLNNSFCYSLEGMHINTGNNIIYHNNIVNNNVQVLDNSFSDNIFNDTNEGNYWSDYNGSDSNNDGIGDVPYAVSSKSQDNFPLMSLNPNAPSCESKPDTEPPRVSKISPTVVSEHTLVKFQVLATDNIKVKSCDFYLDYQYVGNMSKNKFGNNWSVFYSPTVGKHIAYGNCTDTNGNWAHNVTIIYVMPSNDTYPGVLSDNKIP